MALIEKLEQLLASGQDNALLRYGLGNEYLKAGRFADAIQAYENGLRAAEAKGDLQAAREMTVFLKRLRK